MSLTAVNCRGGVFTPTNSTCGSTIRRLNHALLIVGYGTTSDGIDYWLAKVRDDPAVGNPNPAVSECSSWDACWVSPRPLAAQFLVQRTVSPRPLASVTQQVFLLYGFPRIVEQLR